MGLVVIVTHTLSSCSYSTSQQGHKVNTVKPLNSGLQRDKCKYPVYNINVKFISCFNNNFTIDSWISHNRINKRIRRLSKGLPEINSLQ